MNQLGTVRPKVRTSYVRQVCLFIFRGFEWTQNEAKHLVLMIHLAIVRFFQNLHFLLSYRFEQFLRWQSNASSMLCITLKVCAFIMYIFHNGAVIVKI